MSGQVHWMLEVAIKPGKLESFKALANEMSEATGSDEPGALNYEWFLSDDGTNCHIYERYVDSEATMIHLRNFGAKFANRFLEAANPTRFTLYGDPDASVLGALANFGAVHMKQCAGFHR